LSDALIDHVLSNVRDMVLAVNGRDMAWALNSHNRTSVSSPLTLRRLPWVTFSILGASCICQYFGLTGLVIPSWFGDERLTALLFILHPIMHSGWAHLEKNLAYGLVAGTLIESWMMVRCRTRLSLFGVCYGASLLAAFMKWEYVGPKHQLVIGLSGMISAAIAVLLVYCGLFRHHIQLAGVGWLAPLGMVFLSCFLLEPFYNAIFVPFEPSDTVNFHVMAFFTGASLGGLLLWRSRASILQRRS